MFRIKNLANVITKLENSTQQQVRTYATGSTGSHCPTTSDHNNLVAWNKFLKDKNPYGNSQERGAIQRVIEFNQSHHNPTPTMTPNVAQKVVTPEQNVRL